MSKRSSKYPKSSIQNQKKKKIEAQEGIPTEAGPTPKELGEQERADYQNVSRPVPVEKSPFGRFVELLEKWGAIGAGVVIIASFAGWATSLQFNIDLAKDDISKQDEELTEHSKKISDIELFNVAVSKDIENIERLTSEVRDDVKQITKDQMRLESGLINDQNKNEKSKDSPKKSMKSG